MDETDITREFIIESNEGLGRLDQEIVQLEQNPKAEPLLASIFRVVHTIKGTSGMLGFNSIEGVAHLAENLLSQLRSHERELTPPLVSLILESVDAIRMELVALEATGQEQGVSHEDLRRRLTQARDAAPEPAATVSDAKAICERTPETAEALNLAAAESSVRVDVGLLDRLMNMVGELVLARNQILQFNSTHEGTVLNASSQRLDLITTELQETVMKTRMQSIGVVWNKIPRIVRDLAVSSNKMVRVEMQGAETELDRTIIEAIKDPLIHLIRNCCDHGIEAPVARAKAGKPPQGTLSIRAYHESGQVNIEIADDGAGINPRKLGEIARQRSLVRADQLDRMKDRELLDLIFLPGFSTAEKVTNISGRGVGMDVVKRNVESIGGTVEVNSRIGEGTTFRIKIPLTLAIIPGLVVTCGGERFVIPQVNLLEVIHLNSSDSDHRIEKIHGTHVYRRRGSLLPVVHLKEILRFRSDDPAGACNMVVLRAEGRNFGLAVDEINDTQEIVVKPLGKQLKGLNCYAGCTIMGDGRVALILDTLGIAHRSGVVAQRQEAGNVETERAHQTGPDCHGLLLFRSGSFTRVAVPLSLVARLEEFPRSIVELSGGHPVVQYRGRLLPLASLSSILRSDADIDSRDGAVQVIVFMDGDRQIGIVVDEIIDIVEDSIGSMRSGREPGLLGSAVVAGHVTDFLDMQAVLEAADRTWSDVQGQPSHCIAVLLADGSAFSRGLVRNYLQLAGHRILEANDAEHGVRILRSQSVDVIVSALNSGGDHHSELIRRMAKESDLKSVPALALIEHSADVQRMSEKFDRYELHSDRCAVLTALEELTSSASARQLAGTSAGGEA